MKNKNVISVHRDSEMQNKMEAKEEGLTLDSITSEEEMTPNSVMEIKSEIVMCSDSEAGNQMKIKQESLVLDIGLLSDESASSDTIRMKNNTEDYRILPKIEIKEEPWWQEKASSKAKCHLETSPVSDLNICCDVKDEANEDLIIAESTRSPAEMTSNAPCEFIIPDLKEKEGMKGERNNLQFAGEKNVHETYGSDVMETSCIGETTQYYKLKTANELTQSEKVNKCSKGSKKLYVCEICKKCFSQQNAFKAHVLFHQGKRRYKCYICEKSYTRSGHLKAHSLVHEGKRPYKCGVCGKTYTRSGHLKTHSLIHEGKRPYKCDVCEKGFTKMEDLKRHVLIHEGKKPHKCKVCEKSFTQSGHLKTHSLTHEGKRPYKCQVCGKSFTRSGHLKTHSLIHEGIRPYNCDVCKRGFSKMKYLERHVLVHKGEGHAR